MDDNHVVAEIYPANTDLVQRAIRACRDNGATEPDTKLLGELIAIGAQHILNVLRAAGSSLPGRLH